VADRPPRQPARPVRPGQRSLTRRSAFSVGFGGAVGVLAAYVGYRAAVHAFSVLILLLVAVFLAIGLNPAVNRLQRIGLRRGFAVLIVVLAALGVFAGVLFIVIPPVVTQVVALTEAVPQYVTDLQKSQPMRDLNDRFDLLDRLRQAASAQNLTNAVGGVLGGVGLVAGVVFNVLTVSILTIFLLAGFERVKAGAYRLAPASHRDDVRRLGDEILARMGGYLTGAVTIAGLAGLSAAVFLSIAGVPYPFALAVAVAFLGLIPQVGATIGASIAIVVAFFVSIPVGIASLAFFIAYQQFENYVIYPRVMRRAVNVTDLAAIVSVLIGAALLGVVGALIAVPVCAAVQILVRELVLPRQDAA
jgi:predicted PurR-regulated permease PerM